MIFHALLFLSVESVSGFSSVGAWILENAVYASLALIAATNGQNGKIHSFFPPLSKSTFRRDKDEKLKAAGYPRPSNHVSKSSFARRRHVPLFIYYILSNNYTR